MATLKDSGTSKYILLPHLFVKYVTKFKEYQVYEREKYIASILENFSWYPKLLYCDDENQILIFKNVGQVLTNKNKPPDIVKQFEQILKDMASVNVQHNDIKIGELLVDKNNKIYLCDFGWGSVNKNMDCGIGLWACKNVNKPECYYEDATTLKRLSLISTEHLYDMTETHLIIDWTNHFADLKKKIDYPLEIIEVVNMNKIPNSIEVLSRFYGVRVDDFRGKTDYTIYIVKDNLPIYDYRETSKGNRKVNVHMFDLKIKLRKETGGYKIHATDNIQETKDNLKSLQIYEKYYKEKTFTTMAHVIQELNRYPELQWVIMRNFEGLPNDVIIDEHLDVDLLVNDYYLAKRVLDGFSATDNRYDDGKNRILNFVKINNKNVMFDLRFVGDNYYDKQFQTDMLKTRIKHENGFYIPNATFHQYSLIYHAIIHKQKISSTYIKIFKKYGIKNDELNRKSLKIILDKFMKDKQYSYCKPEPSVGYFIN